MMIAVLTTSREALGLEGEHVVPVEPLDLAGAAPVDIFVDRAHLAGVNLQEGDLAVVRSVCGRLDGIPLAAIDWSYGMLDGAERWLFVRLSVFAGTFDLDAIRAVVGTDDIDEFDLLDLVDALVDRSMLVMERRGELARHRMLEPLRQSAAAQMRDETELSAVRRRPLDHVTNAVEHADEAILGPGMGEWMTAFNDSVANIRTAHQYALSVGDLDRAVSLATRPWCPGGSASAVSNSNGCAPPKVRWRPRAIRNSPISGPIWP